MSNHDLLTVGFVIFWLIPFCINLYFCLDHYFGLVRKKVMPNFLDVLISTICVVTPAFNILTAYLCLVEAYKRYQEEQLEHRVKLGRME